MLTSEDLLTQNTMPSWQDINFQLYKNFSLNYLLNRQFEYHLVNGMVINVEFKEWAMKHLWAIQHIDKTVDKDLLFSLIDTGLDINTFMSDPIKKNRTLKYKDRIRMFACIYYVMKSSSIFYVKGGQLEGTKIKIDYIKSAIISEKGMHVGMRLENDVYVPLTILIDTAIDPNKTVKGLYPQKIFKLLIKENDRIVETVYHDKYWENPLQTMDNHTYSTKNHIPKCFDANLYIAKLIKTKLKR